MKGNLVLIGATVEKKRVDSDLQFTLHKSVESHSCVRKIRLCLGGICCKEVAFYVRFEFSGMVTRKITLTCKE